MNQIKCSKCGKLWQISILKVIPKLGYVCPHCEWRGENESKNN